MDALKVLALLAKDVGSSYDRIMAIIADPGEDQERSWGKHIHDWRSYVKPSELRKMNTEEAFVALIGAMRQANEEEWD